MSEQGWREMLDDMKEESDKDFGEACRSIDGEYDTYDGGTTDVCRVDGYELRLDNERDVGILRADEGGHQGVIGNVEYVYNTDNRYGITDSMTLDGDDGNLTLKKM